VKNTLRLFQLLLAVYGFYVVTEYSGDPKPFMALGCIALIIILERWQSVIIEINERQKAPVGSRREQGAKIKQQLDILRQSRSTAVVSNAILELIRDLGLTIRPSRIYPVADYLMELPGQTGHLGLKIIHDVDEPDQDWKQWQNIKEFEKEGEGQNHFLLIAHNLAKNSKAGQQSYVNFSSNTAKLLSQHRVTAMTSLSFGHLYQVCKESSQDSQGIFQRICQHQGGIFEI
jgi:hypothetical protein